MKIRNTRRGFTQKNKKCCYQNEGHSRVCLSGICCYEKRDPQLQTSGMTAGNRIGQVEPDIKKGKSTFCNVGLTPNLYKGLLSGFTLIELLVVVIIIAILAAIALPQYQKAVRKSRLAEIKTHMATLRKAAAVAMMEPEEQDPNTTLLSYAPVSLEITIPFSGNDCSLHVCSIPCSFGKCSYIVDGDVNNPVIGARLGNTGVNLRLDNSGFACNGSSCADFDMDNESFVFSQVL